VGRDAKAKHNQPERDFHWNVAGNECEHILYDQLKNCHANRQKIWNQILCPAACAQDIPVESRAQLNVSIAMFPEPKFGGWCATIAFQAEPGH
jgi:hypothetical protein